MRSVVKRSAMAFYLRGWISARTLTLIFAKVGMKAA
jgi:hypothetical protein